VRKIFSCAIFFALVVPFICGGSLHAMRGEYQESKKSYVLRYLNRYSDEMQIQWFKDMVEEMAHDEGVANPADLPAAKFSSLCSELLKWKEETKRSLFDKLLDYESQRQLVLKEFEKTGCSPETEFEIAKRIGDQDPPCVSLRFYFSEESKTSVRMVKKLRLWNSLSPYQQRFIPNWEELTIKECEHVVSNISTLESKRRPRRVPAKLSERLRRWESLSDDKREMLERAAKQFHCEVHELNPEDFGSD